jgi:CheY-like chemotaxis protein
MNLGTNNELKEQVAKGLAHLHTIVNGNDRRIREIVTTFVNDTPSTFKQIEECIINKDTLGAAGLIHKVKVRYGYLGLDDTLAELSKWEEQLLTVAQENNTVILEKFNKLNNSIITELQTTAHYETTEVARKEVLAGKCVLIAEDDEINVMVFELFVKELGASVIIAANGQEALQFAIEKKPDLIFMDVHMPFLSGLEVITKLRSMGCTCPIISLSASTRLNERQNSLDVGANEFLVKPANRQSINRVLLKYLN